MSPDTQEEAAVATRVLGWAYPEVTAVKKVETSEPRAMFTQHPGNGGCRKGVLSDSREAGAAQSFSLLMDGLNPKLEKKGSRWVEYSGQGTPGQASYSELLKASKAGVGTAHSPFLPCASCSWVLGSTVMDKVCEALPRMNSTGVGGGQGRAQRRRGWIHKKQGHAVNQRSIYRADACRHLQDTGLMSVLEESFTLRCSRDDLGIQHLNSWP